jgi:signal transduction histidine kinase
LHAAGALARKKFSRHATGRRHPAPAKADAGLGLAIVKSCVELGRGTVRCRNRQPSGLEVTIYLNAA